MSLFNFLHKKSVILPEKKDRKLILPNTLGKELANRERVDLNFLLGILPDPDEILSNTGKDVTAYRKIMIDSQVRACVNSRKAGTMSLKWEIDKGKAKSKQAKLIEDIYNDIDIDALNSAILNAPMFGFQPIEIMWEKVGNYILPVDLIPKNQEWFTFGVEGDLRLLTLNNAMQGEELPDRKFLTPTYNDIHNKNYNPYGDRVLSSCFWAVTFKKSTLRWWTTFTEKYGMPYLIGKTNSNSDTEKEAMKDQLENMIQDAVAVLSGNSEAEIIAIDTGKAANADIYHKHLVYCNEMISKAILGQTLTTDGNQGGVGSYALGKVHSGVRDDIVYSDKKIVERAHNQLIRWIYEINFSSGDIPKFTMFEDEDVDEILAKRDETLSRTGVKFTKQYYIKEYGFDDTDFVVTEKEEESQLPNKKNFRSEFAEKNKTVTEEILNKFSDIKLQNQIESVLKPVLSLIKNSNDFTDVKKHLDKLSPEMSSVELENELTKIIFISQIMGRKDARED